MMRRHAELLCQHMGEERGCKEFRKHVSWYLKGFAAGGDMRRSLGLVDTLADLDRLLADLDPDEPFPVSRARHPARSPGLPAGPRRAPRGLARRHRRQRLRTCQEEAVRDHRRVTGTRRSRPALIRGPLRPPCG